MSSGKSETESREVKSSRQLLPRHVAGDASAFPELMDMYRNQVFAFIVRSGVAASSRDDVFQDCFVKIHLAAERYSPLLPLEPWLFTIAQNTIRTHFRKQKVRQIVEFREDVPEGADTKTGAVVIDARDTAAWLEQQIAKLPETQREVICLCGIKDLSQQDVAEILMIPVNTVKTNLSRARAALTQALVRRNAIIRREVSL